MKLRNAEAESPDANIRPAGGTLSSRAGMGLLEMTLVLAVVLVLTLASGTLLFSAIESARENAVLDQLGQIKAAIVGDRTSILPGRRSVIRVGYIGDMGNIPASLDSLLTIGSQPSFTVNSSLQLSAGWRGPYLQPGPPDLLTDPWGNAIIYSTAGGTSASTGAPIVATVRSKGADGIDQTADDAVVEIYEADALSRVIGYVKDPFGTTIAGISVKLSTRSGGVTTTLAGTTDSTGRFEFLNIPRGDAVLQTEPKIIYQRGTAFTSGGDNSDIDLVVENVGRNNATVSWLKLNFTSSPQTYFKEVRVDGSKVFDSSNNPGGSGTQINFSSETLAGTNVFQEPLQLRISSLVSQLPDAIIGTVGAGGTLEIEFREFKDSPTGGGDKIDMTGVTFEIEFSDGSKTLFTPQRAK